jgi:hypothetical protein
MITTLIPPEPVLIEFAAEHGNFVGRGVCAGAAARQEAGRAHRLQNRRGGLVRTERPWATKLLVGRVGIVVDGLGVLLRAEGLVRLVAGLRQRSSPKTA